MGHLGNIRHHILPGYIFSQGKSKFELYSLNSLESKHPLKIPGHFFVWNLDTNCGFSGNRSLYSDSDAARFRDISSERLTILLTFTRDWAEARSG